MAGTTSKPRKDVYQIITSRLVERMENGTIPWKKDWSLTKFPRNYVSGKPYHGINLLLLPSEYHSPFWLTYRQAEESGGHVKKGEKSSPVVFYKPIKETIDDGEGGEMQRIKGFILRYYSVFNADQCEGLPEKEIPQDNPRIEGAEEFISSVIAATGLKTGYGNPAYSPRSDRIAMPEIKEFRTLEEYYSTYFHELTHSTGHPERINRPGIIAVLEGKARFGNDVYSKEELIAEIGASFLCGISGIEESTLENSAAYLRGWIQVLKEDSRMIIQAAGQAQTAVDYLLQKAGVTSA